MKKILFSATIAVSLLASGCGTISQDLSIASQLNAIKSNPKAAKYSKVTARAEKAYVTGDNTRALKLIDIVNKKIERGSTY